MPRALIVDDSSAVRMLIARSLREFGYEVLEAANGRDALRIIAAETTPLRLILADWNMPVMNGLEMLNRIQHNTGMEVRIHDGDFPDEKEVDSKLVRLAHNLNARLFTNDYNLAKLAELQKINYVNLHEVAKCLKVILLPGEILRLKIVREGKDKGQGIGYMPDGTMVVVNNGQSHIGQQVEAEVQSLLQTGAGIIVFAEIKAAQTV